MTTPKTQSLKPGKSCQWVLDASRRRCGKPAHYFVPLLQEAMCGNHAEVLHSKLGWEIIPLSPNIRLIGGGPLSKERTEADSRRPLEK